MLATANERFERYGVPKRNPALKSPEININSSEDFPSLPTQNFEKYNPSENTCTCMFVTKLFFLFCKFLLTTLRHFTLLLDAKPESNHVGGDEFHASVVLGSQTLAVESSQIEDATDVLCSTPDRP